MMGEATDGHDPGVDEQGSPGVRSATELVDGHPLRLEHEIGQQVAQHEP